MAVRYSPKYSRPGTAPVEEDFLMPADGSVGNREQPGYRAKVRMQYNKEAYSYVDPDLLATLGEPPDHVKDWMAEVFGDWMTDAEGNERIKMRLHPHFRRWCLYERVFVPSLGANLWKCFWICMEPERKGYLPPDLRGDKLKAHFTGVLGDYKEVTKADLELVEQFNIQKYGHEAVENMASIEEDKLLQQADQKDDERIGAFLDDNWFLAQDEANQQAGSGQKMRSSACASWFAKSNIERWRTERKNGYSIKIKKSRQEYAAEVAKVMSKLLNWDPVGEAVERELIKLMEGKTDAQLTEITGMEAEEAKKVVASDLKRRIMQRKEMQREHQIKRIKLGKAL